MSLLAHMSCSLALEEVSPNWQEGRDGEGAYPSPEYLFV